MRKIVLFTDFLAAASAVPGHDGDLTIGHRSSNLPNSTKGYRVMSCSARWVPGTLEPFLNLVPDKAHL